MQDERYHPVPHDAAFVAELLADPATKQAYDALMKKYAKKRANKFAPTDRRVDKPSASA
jgi:predicted nucleic acid-binding protein